MTARPYTVQGLAERWGVHQESIYALIRTGRLQHFKVGPKIIRVPAPAVEGRTFADFRDVPTGQFRTWPTSRLAQRVRKRIAGLSREPIGRVYFIRCQGFVKVGYSIGPKGRLFDLQGANPHPLHLLGSISGSHVVERILHSVLYRFKQHREWFHLTPAVRGMIDDLCRSDGGEVGA